MKNRWQLIEIFISNLANSIVHQILEKATNEQRYIEGYEKEMKNSLQIAKIYREKINPASRSLPSQDIGVIKEGVIRKVNSALKLRIDKGYENIDLALVEKLVDDTLKEMNIQQ